MLESLFKRKDSPQYEVRVTLSKIIQMKKIYSFPLLAKEIGVDRKTLGSFLNDEKDVEFMTLLKIVNFIDRNKE